MRPESVQKVLADALSSRDHLRFDRVATLCDCDSVTEYFEAYCDLVRDPTAAEVAEQFPGLPDSQLAGILAMMRSRKEGSRAQIPRDLPGTNSVAELFALAPEEFMRRSLQGADVRSRVIRALERRGDDIPAALYARPEGVSYDIGLPESVSENEVRLPYTVRHARGGAHDDFVEYEHLRRNAAGEWRLVAHHGLLATRGLSSTVISEELANLLLDEPS